MRQSGEMKQEQQNRSVGRTFWDTIHEPGVSTALSAFISEVDPVEVLGTLAYIFLSIYGKSGAYPMRFWVFWALLAGYHVGIKPLSGLLHRMIGRMREQRYWTGLL